VNGRAIIAGGGLAGAAAAAALARAGANVLVIERERAPVHKICGEFLSGEAAAYLARLGLDVAALGGEPISRLRLVLGGRAVSAALPFQGLGVTRRRLDQALLDQAEACGAEIRRGHAIRSIDASRGIEMELAGLGRLHAPSLFLASGKHEVRGARRDASPPEELVGFKMYFHINPAARAALGGHIEMILFRGGYAGLLLVEDGSANLCLLVERARLRRLSGAWEALLAELLAETPFLAARLEGAAPLLEKPLAISRIPYGFVHAPRASDPASLFRLGDQAAVIPSYAGDGMAIALHSAALAADCWLRGEAAPAYHRRLRRDIGAQIGRASTLYRLGQPPLGQRALFGLASIYPGALQWAARLTRVPERARLLRPAPWLPI
jgi:flavin-dependent dehydrogenase